MLAREVQTMAAYNRWMNDKVYSACAELSDEERKADRKAFFKSIHGTLNHILLADRVWFGRFIGRPVDVQEPRLRSSMPTSPSCAPSAARRIRTSRAGRKAHATRSSPASCASRACYGPSRASRTLASA